MKREDSEESLTDKFLPSETQISQFHQWIEKICDPDFILDWREAFTRIISTASSKSGQDVKDEQQMSLKFVLGLSKQVNEENLQDREFHIRGSGDTLIEGGFLNGFPHGVFRKLNEFGDIEFFGCFVNGRLHGTCWKTVLGGGFLLSPTLTFSGEDVAYLYPDARTALVGTFSDGRMVRAVATEVAGISKSCFVALTCDKEPAVDGIPPEAACPCHEILMKPRFFETDKMVDTFFFDPSTDERISSQPLLRDPYEMHFVRLGPSQLPQAGQGLFAANFIEPATVITFYNGVRLKEDKSNKTRDELVSVEIDDEEEWTCYRLALNDDTVLDIPREFASADKYCASMGHKICHSFTPNCEFDDFYHPRFGVIKCIVAKTCIEQGEELTANYQYSLADAPAWYKKQWARHQKQLRRLPDWNFALRNRNTKLNYYPRPRSLSGSSSRTISGSRTPETIAEEEKEEC